jgi:MFS transporter, DHA1 family, inner membrane transport protein
LRPPGFGGLFAVYTYVANTLQEVTQAPGWAEPLMFLVFGLGMVAGTLVTGRVADRGLLRTAGALMVLSALALLVWPFTVQSLGLMVPCVFAIGFSASFGLALQTHLMDVAGKAQTMAAAMHHAAFNAGNALGPWLASMAVAAGLGYPSAGFVGAGLAFAGLAVLGVLALDLRRPRG